MTGDDTLKPMPIPTLRATSRAVSPNLSFAWGSAPYLTRKLPRSRWPLIAA